MLTRRASIASEACLPKIVVEVVHHEQFVKLLNPNPHPKPWATRRNVMTSTTRADYGENANKGHFFQRRRYLGRCVDQ